MTFWTSRNTLFWLHHERLAEYHGRVATAISIGQCGYKMELFFGQDQGDPGLPGLLMLHGFMGTREDWVPVVEALSENYRCIRPDLPGHGKSPRPKQTETHCFDEAAQTIIERLEAAGSGQCAVLGYSMGGRLALYLGVCYPDYFNCVIVESGSPGLRSEEGRQARKAADEGLARRLEILQDRSPEFAEFLADWYEQPLFETLRSNEDRFETLFRRRFASNSPVALADALRTMGTGVQPSLWERVAECPNPILLITGEVDRKYCFIADALCGLSEGVSWEEIPDAGHNTHFEKTDVFLAVIQRFLGEHGAA